MTDKPHDTDPSHPHLIHTIANVKPRATGAKIIDVVGHWSDDETFITPALLIETTSGERLKLIVSTDSELTAPGWILVEDLDTTSH